MKSSTLPAAGFLLAILTASLPAQNKAVFEDGTSE